MNKQLNDATERYSNNLSRRNMITSRNYVDNHVDMIIKHMILRLPDVSTTRLPDMWFSLNNIEYTIHQEDQNNLLCHQTVHMNLKFGQLYDKEQWAYLSFDRLSFTMDDCVWCNNTVGRRVSFDHLEFNSPHATSNQKNIPFMNWTIGFQEIWLQIYFKEVSKMNK